MLGKVCLVRHADTQRIETFIQRYVVEVILSAMYCPSSARTKHLLTLSCTDHRPCVWWSFIHHRRSSFGHKVIECWQSYHSSSSFSLASTLHSWSTISNTLETYRLDETFIHLPLELTESWPALKTFNRVEQEEQTFSSHYVRNLLQPHSSIITAH